MQLEYWGFLSYKMINIFRNLSLISKFTFLQKSFCKCIAHDLFNLFVADFLAQHEGLTNSMRLTNKLMISTTWTKDDIIIGF